MGCNEPANVFTTDLLKEIESYSPVKEEANLAIDEPLNEAAIGNLAEGKTDSVTVVSKGMVIDGDLTSESAVALNGRINGNIVTTKTLGVSGLVVGNSKAENATFAGAKVSGDVDVVTDIKVEDGTIIVGNLTADKVEVNGKVKGSISAATVADFGEKALFVGEVTTAAIHMKEEARVNAKITIVNKSVSENNDEEFDLGV